MYLHKVVPQFKYACGFLGLREAPAFCDLVRRVEEQEHITPTLVCVDGCGIWHPSRAGSAVYVSKILRVPAIGVSKNYLEIQPCIECKNFVDTRMYENADLQTVMTSSANIGTISKYQDMQLTSKKQVHDHFPELTDK